ncbi:MAG: 16S rRNA (cytosine(967)-C(5))-methyltransferase RsmB [Clostridia bacterium]|nr:16S rRNA (cytosine(967)-C(5))-methyltransferase RsmB [Clostridia bacterium]
MAESKAQGQGNARGGRDRQRNGHASYGSGKPSHGTSQRGGSGYGRKPGETRERKAGGEHRSGYYRQRTGEASYRQHEFKPRERQVEGLPSRRVALSVIRDVTEKGAWAATTLDRELQKAGLNPKDRRLSARLAYDVLDRLWYLDYLLDQVMTKTDTDIRLRNVLRLGACQLLLEDHIPDMAATDTAVELCREIGLDGLAGVCNGILRNLIRRRDAGELKEPDREADLVGALSVTCSAPRFLVEQLIADYGEAEAERLLSQTGRDSHLTVRPNRMKLKAEEFEKLLEKKVWECEKGRLPDSWRIENAANISQDTDFLSGNFSIQSEQSQMAVLACNPKRGSMVLDACAAPGGKACYLSELMDGTGRVQAWEVREHRVKLIEAQVKRLGLENVRPICRDATVLREDIIEAMDLVLLDAPCTGTGEMHDKPDSKYRMQPESLEELAALQKKLLDTVSRYVRPGGTLVYSTCSVLRRENAEQVQAFLESHPDFTVDALPETIPENVRNAYATGVQLLPGVDGSSGGFYICRMRRKRI